MGCSRSKNRSEQQAGKLSRVFGFDCLAAKAAAFELKAGSYELQMKVKSNLDDLAQLPVTVYLDNIIKGTMSFRGSKGQWVTQQIRFDTFEGHHYMRLYFGATGLTVDHIAFQLSGGADKEQ